MMTGKILRRRKGESLKSLATRQETEFIKANKPLVKKSNNGLSDRQLKAFSTIEKRKLKARRKKTTKFKKAIKKGSKQLGRNILKFRL